MEYWNVGVVGIPSNTPILQFPIMNNLDPRIRVLVSLSFAIFVALSKEFLTLGCCLGASLLLVLWAKLTIRRSLKHFFELNSLLLFLFFLLPFSYPGTPLFQVYGLTWSYEGMWRGLQILLKANSIMLIFSALLGKLDQLLVGVALERLGMPDKLASMFFLTIRYLDVIRREYQQLVNAMKLRGFRPSFSRHSFQSYGYLVGMLLVKSLDRSERILKAMKCRGFRDRFYTLTTFSLTKSDLLFCLCYSTVLIALMYVEYFI